MKLLLIDSNVIFREGLTKLLQSKLKSKVAATSCAILEVIKAAKEHQPDVVLMDFCSYEDCGTELIQRVNQITPDVCIIIFTHSEISSCFFSAIKAGARGYLRKDTTLDNLIGALVLAAEGKLIVGQPMATLTVEALKSLDKRRHQAKPELISLLTRQEKAVLALLAQSFSNKEIASTLFISENTTRAHMHSIMEKLEARNRFEAAACAIEHGLLLSMDRTDREQE